MGEDREDLILKAIDGLKIDMVKGFEKIDGRITPLETFRTQYESVRTFIISTIVIIGVLVAITYNFQRIGQTQPTQPQTSTIQAK